MKIKTDIKIINFKQELSPFNQDVFMQEENEL